MALRRLGNGGMPPTPEHLKAAIPENESAELGPVLVKMLAFTVALAVLPVSAYYLSRDYYFGEQGTTGAGITAATVANLVLGVFIWVAFQEDGKGVETAESKARKVKKKQ